MLSHFWELWGSDWRIVALQKYSQGSKKKRGARQYRVSIGPGSNQNRSRFHSKQDQGPLGARWVLLTAGPGFSPRRSRYHSDQDLVPLKARPRSIQNRTGSFQNKIKFYIEQNQVFLNVGPGSTLRKVQVLVRIEPGFNHSMTRSNVCSKQDMFHLEQEVVPLNKTSLGSANNRTKFFLKWDQVLLRTGLKKGRPRKLVPDVARGKQTWMLPAVLQMVVGVKGQCVNAQTRNCRLHYIGQSPLKENSSQDNAQHKPINSPR